MTAQGIRILSSCPDSTSHEGTQGIQNSYSQQPDDALFIMYGY